MPFDRAAPFLIADFRAATDLPLLEDYAKFAPTTSESCRRRGIQRSGAGVSALQPMAYVRNFDTRDANESR